MLLKHEGYVHTTSWPHVVTLNVLNDPENMLQVQLNLKR